MKSLGNAVGSYTTLNGVNGLKFGTLFLPSVGSSDGANDVGDAQKGISSYWSSTRDDWDYYAWRMFFGNGDTKLRIYSSGSRNTGYCVRCAKDRNN
jgi:hypothetical protein